jgi:hypothetical protein
MNMIPTFFGMPQSVVKGRFLHKMKGSALKLYTALLFSVQAQSSREVVLTTAQCQQLVGGSHNSHSQARKQLVELGLVRCEPLGQDGFVYVVCDPDTRELWDDDHKRQGREIGKPSSEGASLPASKARARSRSKMDDAGVSFNYGHNVQAVPERATALLQPQNGVYFPRNG